MKKSRDPRHIRRIQIVRDLFAYSFASQKNSQSVSDRIISKLTQVDAYIAKAAPEWPLEKVARIDLAILRLAVYEIAIDNKEPVKVIIDEAIEIAKAYGNEKSSSFINGVLGTITKLVESKMNEPKTLLPHEQEVLNIITEKVGTTDMNITRDTSLYVDLNASKLETADIIQTIEEKYSVKFDPEELKTLETVGDLLDLVTDNVE